MNDYRLRKKLYGQAKVHHRWRDKALSDPRADLDVQEATVPCKLKSLRQLEDGHRIPRLWAGQIDRECHLMHRA